MVIMLVIAGLLSAWVVASPFGLWKLHRLKTERKSLYMQNIRLSEDNTRLEKQINSLKTDSAFQEHVVRKRLGWVKDGEMLYRFLDEKK